MAADHDRESGSLGIEVQLCKIVQHINRDAAQLKHLGFGQLARPHSFVDVATHRGYRSDCRKLIEYLGGADIPSMNDVFRPAGLRLLQDAATRECQR